MDEEEFQKGHREGRRETFWEGFGEGVAEAADEVTDKSIKVIKGLKLLSGVPKTIATGAHKLLS